MTHGGRAWMGLVLLLSGGCAAPADMAAAPDDAPAAVAPPPPLHIPEDLQSCAKAPEPPPPPRTVETLVGWSAALYLSLLDCQWRLVRLNRLVARRQAAPEP